MTILLSMTNKSNSSHHQLIIIIISNHQSAIMLFSGVDQTTMGIQSQQRSPEKKKMKQRRGKMNSFFQPNQAASIQKPSVLNGTKACKGCTHHLSVYKHGHDLTCPKTDYFGMTQQQKSDAIKEKKRMQAQKKAPSSEAPNVGASRSHSLGDGFLRQKQQSTGDTISVPAVVVPPVVATTTATTATTATKTITEMTLLVQLVVRLPSMRRPSFLLIRSRWK
jgi:hypothetical protein